MDDTIFAFLSAWNKHQLKEMQKYISEDMHMVQPDGSILHGKQAILSLWEKEFALFPDLRLTQSLRYTHSDDVLITGSICASGKNTAFHMPIAIHLVLDKTTIKVWESYCDCTIFHQQMESMHFDQWENKKDIIDRTGWKKQLRKLFHDEVFTYITDQNLDDLKLIFDGNPKYFYHLHTTAQQELKDMNIYELPNGKTLNDKAYFMLYLDKTPLCAIDLIMEYPDQNTAFIGFFMMNKAFQKKGKGSAVIQRLCAFLKTLGFLYVRLGYIKGNEESQQFWEKQGFTFTGIEVSQKSYIVVVAQKSL